MKFQSTKLIDGFSTCFRQEKSAPSHCSLLHGYALSFKVTFEGELDYRNWVCDFGFMKRSETFIKSAPSVNYTPHEWFNWMFDHTVLVAGDDTELKWFLEANDKKLMRVIVLPSGVGCEKFAELVFKTMANFIHTETAGRVRVVSVECIENNKNSAICYQ